MAYNVKGKIISDPERIIKGLRKQVDNVQHPLEPQDIEFLLTLLAETKFEGNAVQTVFTIAHRLQEEYLKMKGETLEIQKTVSKIQKL